MKVRTKVKFKTNLNIQKVLDNFKMSDNIKLKVDANGYISKKDFLDFTVQMLTEDQDFKNKITHNPREISEAIFKAKDADKISEKEIDSGNLQIGAKICFFAVETDMSGSIDVQDLKTFAENNNDDDARELLKLMGTNNSVRIFKILFKKYKKCLFC